MLLTVGVMAVASVALAPVASADEPPSGVVERTWFPLRPDDTGSLVGLLQARLTWLGYRIDTSERAVPVLGASTLAALNAFQAKFALKATADVAKPTWDAVARLAPKPSHLPTSCKRGTVVCIDMRQRILRLVQNGTVTSTMDARFGFEGQETRAGHFRVASKSRDHVSTIFNTPMPYALFFDGNRAIHYSYLFARDGYAGASHGCVNVRDRAKARALFNAVDVGTRVMVTAD
jgi:hypothetical protein